MRGAFQTVKKTVPYQNSRQKDYKRKEREKRGDKRTGIRNEDGRRIGRWKERRKGGKRCSCIHLDDGSTRNREGTRRIQARNTSIRELTIHFFTFLPFHFVAAFDLAPYCNNAFAILTGPLIIETAPLKRDELPGRGRGERRKRRGNLAGGFHHRRDGNVDGSRMYRTYRSFPLGRQ